MTKLLIAGGLLLAFIAAVKPDDPPFVCPSADELKGCVCIESIKQLSCPKGAHPLVLKKPYKFDSVLIQGGEEIANFFEKVRQDYLLTDSLIVQNFTAPPGEAGQLAQDDLEKVMQIVQ